MRLHHIHIAFCLQENKVFSFLAIDVHPPYMRFRPPLSHFTLVFAIIPNKYCRQLLSPNHVDSRLAVSTTCWQRLPVTATISRVVKAKDEVVFLACDSKVEFGEPMPVIIVPSIRFMRRYDEARAFQRASMVGLS